MLSAVLLWWYGNDSLFWMYRSRIFWVPRSTECRTSSTEPAFYLNFKAISPLVEACYGFFILIHYRAAEATCNKNTQTTIACCENTMRDFFCTEAVTCSKNSGCPKDLCGNYSFLSSPLLLVRVKRSAILRKEVNSLISRLLTILLEFWVTFGLSYGSAHLSC